ncbi:MAG: ABC transporter ATP-binding protein [Pirellulales bacterium]
MPPPIISIENLSKAYMVGHESGQRESYMALRDVLGRHAKNFVRKTVDMLKGRQIIQGDEVEEFWALRDVSFDVEQGQVVGVIGRNGAGKSTLLKVLSRITEPTRGRITLRGRVASLLEVGTGFHPELTGRENIFLNGAILGMGRREILRKFEEIVAFAEVEKFLDTPVKRYSSGMYVRLAFAVAAHLEPEILIVDEVLAVGDAHFQKKCLGKLKDVTGHGRTVLFVSHNMAAIKSLCTRAILLSAGKLKESGDVNFVCDKYLQSSIKNSTLQNRTAKNQISYVSFCETTSSSSEVCQTFYSNDPITIRFGYHNRESIQGLRCGVRISTSDGGVLVCYTPEDEGQFSPKTAGDHIVSLTIPKNSLLKGLYQISASLWDRTSGEIFDDATDIATFEVEPAPERAYLNELVRPGVVQTYADWKLT